MARETIPKKTKENVLDEYDYKCAVCAGERPHLHHIDEDATNNSPNNLLPLCPNCHLRDQHNPTRKIEIPKLQLFREYKDPCILKPQFHPLYSRQLFLDDANINEESTDDFEDKAKELVDFVASFEMGEFYSNKISGLIIKKQKARMFFPGDPPSKFEREDRKDALEYRTLLVTNRNLVKELLIELLRYQAWANA